MTISVSSSISTFLGNGSTSTFTIPWIMDSPSDIFVYYTNSSGTQTPLTSSQYTLFINAPATDAIWGIGGTITYPISGSPIANGTSLTVQRMLPLTQLTSIANQGNFDPEVIEATLDTLCMQIQQVSARTGQFRGVWITNTSYNFGDIVQDVINGADTLSYYMCINANTSSVWATDLSKGDWQLAIQSTIPAASLPLSIGNGGTGATTAGQALTNLGGIGLSSNNIFTGTNTFNNAASFTGGSITVPTAVSGDSSTTAASTAWVSGANSTTLIKTVKSQVFTSSGTYTPSIGMLYCIVEGVGGGGGSGGVASTSSSQSAASGGGGGGEYRRAIFTAAGIGVSASVTIGAGGTAATAGNNNGGTGGSTLFGGGLTIVGGSGGTGCAATGAGSLAVSGGVGGTGGSGGFLQIPGEQGGAGSFLNGLGSGLGTLAFAGTGGKTILSAQTQEGLPPSTGNVGNIYGAGGSGSSNIGSQSARPGAAGASGIIIVTEFCSQ